MAEKLKALELKKLGGRISLGFVNTCDWRTSEDPKESLESYENLVAWCRRVRILSEQDARILLGQAEGHSREAAAVLEKAIDLREAMYGIFSAVSHGHSPEREDLDSFNAVLSATMARSRIVPGEDGFVWDQVDSEKTLDRMLYVIVHDAADLLTSKWLARVGECAGDGCGWLFLDTSRNRSRQWCSMDSCGNRAKARRFYKKKTQQP